MHNALHILRPERRALPVRAALLRTGRTDTSLHGGCGALAENGSVAVSPSRPASPVPIGPIRLRDYSGLGSESGLKVESTRISLQNANIPIQSTCWRTGEDTQAHPPSVQGGSVGQASQQPQVEITVTVGWRRGAIRRLPESESGSQQQPLPANRRVLAPDPPALSAKQSNFRLQCKVPSLRFARRFECRGGPKSDTSSLSFPAGRRPLCLGAGDLKLESCEEGLGPGGGSEFGFVKGGDLATAGAGRAAKEGCSRDSFKSVLFAR